MPQEDRTIGRTFESPEGKVFRPSMFVTLTLPSWAPTAANTTSTMPAQADRAERAGWPAPAPAPDGGILAEWA